MSSPQAGARTFPTVFTWRAVRAPRMESVRVQLIGNRIKASGRIVGGQSPEHPAFSASYDLETDELGVTRRLSIRRAVAEAERQMSIARDEEGTWMVDGGPGGYQRSTFGGALDVDVVLSPFFNTLPIRRLDLQRQTEEAQVPVVYVDLLALRVEAATLTYSSASDGISVLSPVSSSSVSVDSDGLVIDYQGLAERI